ncbi:MAG: hypothetical protein FJX65_11375 [Alphaproteobacteria bacterium]|nr:hypothetical protein [Alphaproteobacteria bacterium]
MLFAVALAACAAAPPPSAVGLCGDRTTMAQILGQAGERAAAGGLEEGGVRVIELWTSPLGGFTVTATNRYGATCVLATGRAWRQDGGTT